MFHAYPATFPRQPSWENESGWVESFNVVQILSEMLKAENRSLFKSLSGYGIHKSLMTLKLPVGEFYFNLICFWEEKKMRIFNSKLKIEPINFQYII